MSYDKIVDSSALDAAMTATANAIREKTGVADPIAWDTETGFQSEIEGIQTGGGGDEVLEKMLTGTTFEIESDLEEIAAFALYSNYWATSVSIPNATSVGASAFAQMNKCTHISAPKLTAVPGRFAWTAGSLTSVDLPAVTTIESQAFQGTKLTTFPNLSSAEYIKDSAFQNISTITDTSLSLPSIIVLGQAVFQGIASLELVDLGENLAQSASSVAHIRNNLFLNCTGLKTLILRGATMASLQNVNAFSGTSFASGGTGGTVYVPQALIESYQTATNWSTLYAAGTCNFVAIEGSEYE